MDNGIETRELIRLAETYVDILSIYVREIKRILGHDFSSFVDKLNEWGKEVKKVRNLSQLARCSCLLVELCQSYPSVDEFIKSRVGVEVAPARGFVLSDERLIPGVAAIQRKVARLVSAFEGEV